MLHDCARAAANKFTPEELQLLQKTWQDLADRSTGGKGVDKDTFMQYVSLNGLLGERLYHQFDVKRNNCLDFDEFVTGLSTICRGSTDDKIHFLFDMYDVSDDHTVSKDEFATLVNQIPKHVLDHTYIDSANALMQRRASAAPQMDETSSDTESEHGATVSSPHVNTGQSFEDEVDMYTNHDIIEKAFQECDLTGEGRLHYEEFKMWVNRNPGIIEYFDDVLPYAGSKKNESSKRSSMKKTKDIIPHHHSHHHGMSRKLSKNQWNSGMMSEDGTMGTPRYHNRAKSLLHVTPEGDNPPALTRTGSVKRDPSPSPSNSRVRKSASASAADDASDHGLDDLVASSGGHPLSRQESSEQSVINAPRYRYNMDPESAEKIASESVEEKQHNDKIYELDGHRVDSELMTYMLLERAIATTKNDEIKRVIREVIDHIPGINNIIANNNYNSSTDAMIHAADAGEFAERMSEVGSEADIVLEGNLWKKGKFLHLWSKRWYILSGNCMYYYDDHNKEDMSLKGVVFLTGCLVELVEDNENEAKGYWGFEVTHQDIAGGEHHKHEKRTFFCKSPQEREKWLTALQHAAEMVPIEDDWVIGKELGKGRFSIVYECVHMRNDKHCAVKVIDKRTIDPEDKGLLRTEIAVLKLVDHPSIIKMEGIYESKNYIYIVMEMLSGGELFERLIGRPRLTEVEAAKLIKPLLEAVAYLHDLGIVHRDLKPENILCGETLEEVKIADFGLSKMVLPKEKLEGACGTLSYVAPEVLTQQGYGVPADVWSLGVILFLVICGKLPFDGDDQSEIIRKTISAEPMVNPTVWGKLSEDVKSLMLAMLHKNPKKRITARDTLHHPFIVNNVPHV